MPVQAFRCEFSRLLETLGEVDAVVVPIDDPDRCLPETVVETFEAIRLFLNAPKTAYVIAAHQAIVESAIDARYHGFTNALTGSGLGAQYLEKMIQHKVSIPTLSGSEAETYLHVLLAVRLRRPLRDRHRRHRNGIRPRALGQPHSHEHR
ncbi:hypothetical protein GT354_03040 [Streptomyces sp. SID3343]|nr:hypothetical protein [Streptomyces sp. SID3343]